MPVVFSFNSLISTIQSIVERAGAINDPTAYAYIPTAINLTEQKMARELKIQGFIRIVDWTMQANVAAYQKPDRWRENISMQVGTVATTTYNVWSPVYTRGYEFCRAYWPNAVSATTPKYYADMDYTHWWFSPTPDVAYPAQAVYWELPPLLDANNQQNWTIEYAPNALLHGSCAEMYVFLKNAAERAVHSELYDRDMAALAGEDIQKMLDRMEKRTTS